MKEIPLTKGKVALVDDEDYEKLSKNKWHASWDGHNWYAARGVRIGNKIKKISMHREILNAPKEMQVDHINGNGLDNRKENLRLCTHQQNLLNKKNSYKNNKLGIKGVCWRDDTKRFQAQICVGGKNIRLGYFNVLGDADQAYREAEKRYFGEFARSV